MKKLLVLVLALMMVLSLAACGGGKAALTPSGGSENTSGGSENTSDGNENPSGSGQEQSPDSTDSGKDNTESYDLTTIEGYLGQFGLTEDVLKLPTFTRFGTSFSIETKEISGIDVYQSEKMSAEQKQAYVKAVTDALSAIADDGKISSVPYGVKYTLDVDYNKSGMLSFSGMIMVNGKKVTFVLTVNNSLDNNDPDMAYPAVTFSIEY